MITALLFCLSLGQPALAMETPDWAFVGRSIPGDTTQPALVDAFLAQIDAESAPLVRYASPFEAGEADPFDGESMVDPALEAREVAAGFAINAVLDDLEGLVQP
jgi:hypothetical protein